MNTTPNTPTLQISAYYDVDRKPATLRTVYINRIADGSMVAAIMVRAGTSEEAALAEARALADELEREAMP